MSRLHVRRDSVVDPWYATFSIEQQLTRDNLIDILAGLATWYSAVDLKAGDWTQPRIIEEVKETLRRDGFNARDESSTAWPEQIEWAIRQVDKIWPKVTVD